MGDSLIMSSGNLFRPRGWPTDREGKRSRPLSDPKRVSTFRISEYDRGGRSLYAGAGCPYRTLSRTSHPDPVTVCGNHHPVIARDDAS